MARIFRVFGKKRKRKNDETLPDGNFALSPEVEDEAYGFNRNSIEYTSLRESVRSDNLDSGFTRTGSRREDANFQRNGSVRRSLQNHRGVLYMAHMFTTENRKLREEKEFMARRVEFLEEQLRLQENVPNSGILSQQTSTNQTTQSLINEKLELQNKLKTSEECRVQLEQSLIKESQRLASFENTMSHACQLLTINEQKTDINHDGLGEIKDILLSNKDTYCKMLSEIDENTRLVLNRVNTLVKLPTLIPRFQSTKFDSLSEEVKVTFRLLGEIVGVRWPKLIIALGLSSELIENFRYEIQHGGCSQEEIVWRILGIWCNNESDLSLSKLDVACLKIGVCIFSDKPMPKEHRQILDQQHLELVEGITDALVVIPYLKKHAMIMPNVVEHIISAQARPDRVQRLIDSLVTLGDKGLHAFVRALKDSGHERLAQGILAAEARLLSEAIHVPLNATFATITGGIQSENLNERKQEDVPMALYRKSDLPLPEVDRDNLYPIGTRYFSDLKVSVKHMEALLMEMACKESLKY